MGQILEGDTFSVSGVDVTITDYNVTGYCSYKDGLKGAAIIYTYPIDTDGFMCVDLNFPKRNNVSIWKNGAELYNETMSLPQMLAVGDVQEGDVLEIRATCKNANESGNLTVHAALLDEERFVECYEVLSASKLNLTYFSNTKVSGTISCNRDGLLYTSIPQNGNWYAQVDGEDAEVILTGDAMVGVLLTEGDHEVTFTYHNKAFSFGWKVSLACAIAFVVFIYISRQKESPKGKYSKK